MATGNYSTTPGGNPTQNEIGVTGHRNNSTFIMVYEDVWQALLGDPPALAVYMALLRRTYEGNRAWYGTKKSMAQEAGVSVATFERRIVTLRERGLVQVTQQFRNPKTGEISTTKEGGFVEQIQNIYTIRDRTPEWFEAIAESVRATPTGRGVTSQRSGGSPHKEAGVTSQRGANIDPLHKPQNIDVVKVSGKGTTARGREAEPEKKFLDGEANAAPSAPGAADPRAGRDSCPLCDDLGQRPHMNLRTGLETVVWCRHTDVDAFEVAEVAEARKGAYRE